MKPGFFDIEDLKTKPLPYCSNRLNHCPDSFDCDICFVVRGRCFRVRFDCIVNVCHDVNFYFHGSRSHFNCRTSRSFRELIDKVYDLLND